MIEEWKDIKGYEGLYQVSNLGRVYSNKSNKLLKSRLDRGGYSYLNLYNNGISKWYKIHRLVAIAFIPNPENKLTVNHIDEDKTNNVVSNLEWATMKEQNNHGTRLERTSITQGTKIIAIDIANGEYNTYHSLSECGRKLKLNKSNICSVLKGRLKQTGGYIFEYSK